MAGKPPLADLSTLGSRHGPAVSNVPLNRSERGRLIFIGLLLFVVVGCVFLPSLRNGFVQWDDDINIYSNPNIQTLDWPHLRWMFTDCSYTPRYRPLNWLSWAITYRLFGPEPLAFHLGDLLLHMTNALLVFGLLRNLLARFPTSLPRQNAWPATLCAGIGALCWAIHPLRVEAVAWANCRIYTQSLCFLLLSLICYLRSIESAVRVSPLQTCRYWLAVLFFALSLLTYPTGMPFVLVLVVLNVYPLRRLPASMFSRANDLRLPRVWLEIIPFVLVTLPVVVITLWSRTHATGIWDNSTVMRDFGWGARLSQAFYIWAYYLWKPWWPLNISPVYTMLDSFNPVDWPFLLSAGLVLGLTVLVVWKRRHWPGLLVLWICYLALLLPMLGLTEHPHSPSDRYSYIPAMLWSVLLAAGLFKLRHQPKVFARSVAVSLVLIALLGAMSNRLTPKWRDSVSLFEGILTRLGNDSPRHADIYWRLGRAYAAQNRLDEAIRQYQAALHLKPDYSETHDSFGDALLKRGQTDEAIRQYQEALRLKPDYAMARYNFGVALVQNGQIDEAIHQYQEALRLEPRNVDAHNNLGTALDAKGQLDEAIRQYQEAIRLNPDHAEAHNNLGAALDEKGQTDEAIRHYQAALRLKPDHADAHNNLGLALSKKGQTDEAIRQYQEAIRLKPEYTDAHYNLGVAFFQQGRTTEAIQQFREAARLKPNHAEAHSNLGAALGLKGETDEAIRQFQEALLLKPDLTEARRNLDVMLATRDHSSPPPSASTNR